ncbi:MAG TPA: MG2 domain-containing protein, partial [Terriglobia bacterium]|nr:MG2 domain-containing protein [Terriglobia bacterium]
MKRPLFVPSSILFLLAASWGQTMPGRVESFTPQGRIKQVREVRVLFSQPMVPLGDPKESLEPFDILGPAKGTARWADSRNWIYDFSEDLPAGVRMEFRFKAGLKTLDGNPLAGKDHFEFNTGGPVILNSRPHEGTELIDEEQIFILKLDGTPTDSSLNNHVYFSVEGITERVAVRVIQGEDRDRILKSERWIAQNWKSPLVLVQPKRHFPNSAKVRLVWGKEVATESGLANDQDQILPFIVRPPFTAALQCLRVNPEAGCVPISRIHLALSAPVAWDKVSKAVIKDVTGRQWVPKRGEWEEDSDREIQTMSFEGPFPEKAELKMYLPSGLHDDAGRPLSNASKFPLTFRTDEYPPLVKFSADFGILELHSDPALPVTLRNVEPEVSARSLGVNEGESSIHPEELISKTSIGNEEMEGRLLRIPPGRANQIMLWLQKVKSRDPWHDGNISVFGPDAQELTKGFKVPKLQGAKSFEVVGIPLPQPGFYIVEIASELLGAALLENKTIMYVPTTVLVTNLSVHFKWGQDSSLVWVTTLDTARPVTGAKVEIRNCEGTVLWQGVSDSQGVARPNGLPLREECPRCSYHRLGEGLLITAQVGEDFSFVHSSWTEGIEPWRFQLPTEYETDLTLAHTILDRPLFRAGETVHMKHILRRHLSEGLINPAPSDLPTKLVIQHLGSDQKYELALKWKDDGSAESSWTIPHEAKLGSYSLNMELPGKGAGPRFKQSGLVRVEEFRVPLMRASILPPAGPLVAPSTVTYRLQAAYLSGGGAANLPVKFRNQVMPGSQPNFEATEAFVFANGRVEEGIVRGGELPENEEKPALKSTALTLDKYGAGTTEINGLPKVERPLDLVTEMEYSDPNGEAQTVSRRVTLWPARWLVGMKVESWTVARESIKLQAAVIDLEGKPIANVPLKVDLYQSRTFSHRKRLVGGFYAYDHHTETKRLGQFCEGKTNDKGLMSCEATPPVAGNVMLQAIVKDPQGLESSCNFSTWVVGKDQWWFEASNDDRMDLLPERKSYEPGETARFQVRMPFREATALVSVEREGVSDVFIRELSGREPVIELPIKGNYTPNIFISVLAVRGRVSDVQPTATIDLGRPAFKLGIAEIKVGWKTHQLQVKLSAPKNNYLVREKVPIQVSVRTADGKPPNKGSEVAVAAVDEGLLELMPNDS